MGLDAGLESFKAQQEQICNYIAQRCSTVLAAGEGTEPHWGSGGIFPAESKAWFCSNRAAPAPRALQGGVQIRARLLHGRLAERGSVQLLGS